MIVTRTIKATGHTTRLEIDDSKEWDVVCNWICVKMGHTIRTDDPVHDRIMREQDELRRVSRKQSDKRPRHRAEEDTKAEQKLI